MQLLHAGTLLTGQGRLRAARVLAQQRRKAAQTVTIAFIQHHAPPGFTAAGVSTARIWEHSAATRGGREAIFSTANSRSLRSEGHHIQVSFAGRPTIGRVERFLRVLPPPALPGAADQQPEQLRLAVCVLYSRQPPRGQASIAHSARLQAGGGERAVPVRPPRQAPR